jgi:uncharacterized protein (DUF1684 family)
MGETTAILDLLDWKRRVFAVYAAVRDERDPSAAWRLWRSARDELFARHPQSPLPAPERASFTGLDYFDYDSELRTTASVVDTEPRQLEIGASGGTAVLFRRFAIARFELRGEAQALELYWLEGYGGGIFLPFRDETSTRETYGAGRYLLDTVKGADLGVEDNRLVLDFNFAYNPSCAYDPQWICPLAPTANSLPLGIRAGERHEVVSGLDGSGLVR